jgi:hypothetical protein
MNCGTNINICTVASISVELNISRVRIKIFSGLQSFSKIEVNASFEVEIHVAEKTDCRCVVF